MMPTFLSETQKGKLKEKGFCSAEVTMTAAEANIKGLLYASPFVIFLTFFYRLLLIHRSILPDTSGFHFYLLLVSILTISVVLHEILHGIGWAVIGKAGRSAISFHISSIMPTCSCSLVLARNAYLVGVLLPLAVLGSFSTLFLLFYPGTISVLTMLTNFILAGEDLVIASKIIKSNYLFIADHPTKAGFIGYCSEM